MANAVDKLFDRVLPGLQPREAEDWPESDHGANEPDPLEDQRGSPDDKVEALHDVDSVTDTLDAQEPLESANRNLIEGGIRNRGMDVLAFYKSRRMLQHGPFPGKWGIFYLEPGLAYLRSAIADEYLSIKRPAALALELLRAHEHFHFRADLQTLLFEATLGHRLYLPLRVALARGGRSVEFAEEALANRQVMDWAKKHSVGIKEFAYEFMKLQPGAYARFDDPKPVLAAEWAGTVVGLKPPGMHMRQDLAGWVEATPDDFMRPSLCPEHIVRPVSLLSWIPKVFVLPSVLDIRDGDDMQKALNGNYAQLREPWEETKRKLKADRHLRGLDFKPWRRDGQGAYSVRVNDKFRAHLRHDCGGAWTAYRIGNHKEMGHG